MRVRTNRGGSIALGKKVCIAAHTELIASGGELHIGDDSFIGRGAVLVARSSISIGRDALIAEYVTIRDQNHGVDIDSGLPYREQPFTTAPITIGDNVWIGAKATILAGVTIGDHAVIGAGAVVTSDVPPYAVAAGVPARVIRQRSPGEPPPAQAEPAEAAP